MADSISIFAEGTFEEQVQELAEFISRSRPESERQAFTDTFEEALKTGEGQTPLDKDTGRKQRIISQVLDSVETVGEGSDKEVEGFFNLLSSHILSIYPENSSEYVSEATKIANVIVRSPHDQPSIKYRVLANLFNALPRTSPVRLNVCKALLSLASENDELDTLQLSVSDVSRWLNEWNVSPEEKNDFLKAIVDAFSKSGDFAAEYAFSVAYVQSLPASSAESAALSLIASALRAPAVYNFDSVLKLQNIQAQKTHPLFTLLKIINEEGLDELKSWMGKNISLLESYQLEAANLERKARLLILSELGFSKIGQNIPYCDIASALQIEVTDVEKWVIDVIRAGLLSGKLSQVSHSLLVVRATPRGFAAEHWKTLEERLLIWKEGLAGIQSVLESAAQNGGAVALSSTLNPQDQPA